MSINTCQLCNKEFSVNPSKITIGNHGLYCDECLSSGNPAQQGIAWTRENKETVKAPAKVMVAETKKTTTCNDCGVEYVPQNIGEFGGEDIKCPKCNTNLPEALRRKPSNK